MSELRAPDPTLTAYDGRDVTVYDFHADTPVAHRRDLPHGRRGVQVRTWHARWFAVPCRECFPDAPPPGREFYNLMDQRNRVQVRTRPVKGLAWQVQP